MRPWILLSAILFLGLAVAACGGDGPVAPAGASAGKELFAQQILRTEQGSNSGCITCHSLQAGQALVGPSVAGIASRAGSTVAGESAEAYLKNAIVDPNAHLASGCNMRDPQRACLAGLMPQNYGDILSPGQVDSLIAYLLP